MATESEIALGAAQTATTKATEASASATSASASATTATTKASEASTSATSAATSATTASQKATQITTLVASIETAQGICETKADDSATSAEEASQSAALAGSRAESAQTYATSASQSATVATGKASEAAASAASAIQNFNTLDAAKVDKVTGKGLSTEDYSSDEKTKLSGIATGATANDTDANLKSRANHTGTQTASTISDFVATVRGAVLTGLSLATNAAISATDTVLGALGKLQKQITDHLADTSNPHNVTKTQVGLSNVPNTDATNPANISQSALYRFVSDTEKATWNGKESAITAGTASQYYRGDKTFQTLDKTAVGLSNIDNTSDANKPISTAMQTALNAKAPIASPSFTGNTTVGDNTTNSQYLIVNNYNGATNTAMGGIKFMNKISSGFELARIEYGQGAVNVNDGYLEIKIGNSGAFSSAMKIKENGNTGFGTTDPKSKMHVVGLPTYADNTAALAGGLTAGAFYRTSIGVLMVTF